MKLRQSQVKNKSKLRRPNGLEGREKRRFI
jgi:hypothetical protein